MAFEDTDLPDLPAIPGPQAPGEPLAPVSLILGGVTSVLTLLVAFNVPLTDNQQSAILGVVPFLVAIGVWAWGRRKVFSPKTVRAMVLDEKQKSFDDGLTDSTPRTMGNTSNKMIWDPPKE